MAANGCWLWWLVSMSQSDRPSLSESRLVSQSNRLLFSCRCCSCRCTSCGCSVFGPGLPINRINSLLINERRTVKKLRQHGSEYLNQTMWLTHTSSKINDVKLLINWRSSLTKQKILRFHITMHKLGKTGSFSIDHKFKDLK